MESSSISEHILSIRRSYFLDSPPRSAPKFAANAMAMAQTIRSRSACNTTGFSVTLGSNLLSSLARPRFHLRGTRGNFWKSGLDPQEDGARKDHEDRRRRTGARRLE